jgi:YD repeat-containing protein
VTRWERRRAGHLTELATTNATFTYSLNRAGHRLSEDAQVTGDPQNGEATFAYDPLGRLAGYTPPGSAQVPYGWDKVPNRTSAGGVTTTFDAADRPTSTGFATDLDAA